MNSLITKRIVTFGEVLWDCLPSGLFLGGAPLNVAYHAARLGADSFVASAVGRDFLGEEAIRRVEASGVSTTLLQRHAELLTGVSIATLSDSGDASYEIREPVAWDDIRLSEDEAELVVAAEAFVYGSLAARSDVNLQLLENVLDRCEGLKVCDVNLRAPFDDVELALRLAKRADVLKVNEEELVALSGVSDGSLEETMRLLQELTGADLLCVTLGKDGAKLLRNGEIFSGKGEAVEVADTIGAGDSFTAALTMGLLEGRTTEACLKRALALSTFVAGKSGAQPQYVAEEVIG